MQRGFVQVHFHVVLDLRIFDVPVDIHNARRLLEYLFDLGGQFDLPFVVRPINFSNQRLQYRWTGRYFCDLDACSERLSDLV